MFVTLHVINAKEQQNLIAQVVLTDFFWESNVSIYKIRLPQFQILVHAETLHLPKEFYAILVY